MKPPVNEEHVVWCKQRNRWYCTRHCEDAEFCNCGRETPEGTAVVAVVFVSVILILTLIAWSLM